MTFARYGSRFWAVYDEGGALIAVTVYKKGAREVIARLLAARAGASHQAGASRREG